MSAIWTYWELLLNSGNKEWIRNNKSEGKVRIMNESKSKVFNAARANFGVKGWVIMFYLFVCCYLNTNINTGWQNIVGYWQETFGWDTTTMMSLISVAQFLGIAVCFVLGRIATKYSAKKIGLLIGTLLFVSMFAIPFVKNYALMCTLQMTAVICDVAWAFTINPIFVSTWFPRKKGIVMGLITMGIPLGSGTCTMITHKVSAILGQNFGMSFATLAALVALLLLIVVVKDTPSEAGYHPDNDESLTDEDVARMQREADEIAMKSPWTTARMLGTWQSYVLGLSIGCCALLGAGVNSTNMLRMLGMGYEKSFASSMMLFTAICACIASYLFGILDAKKGPRFAMMAVFVCGMLSSVFNAQADSVPMLVLGLIFTACVNGGAANFVSSLTIEWWGAPNFKKAYGVIYPIHQIPGSLGAMYMMQISSRFGGYTACFIGLFFISLAALLAFSTIKNGNFVKEAEKKWAAEA